MSQVFIATIKNKKLELASEHHRAIFRDFLSANEGKKLRIELVKNPTSDEMRGYYFAAVVPTVKKTVAEWSTLPNEDVHEMLKKIFNSFDCFNPLTKRVERYGRSAMGEDSNTKRAIDFIEKIRVWLLEDYKVELPNPEEYKQIRDSAPLKN